MSTTERIRSFLKANPEQTAAQVLQHLCIDGTTMDARGLTVLLASLKRSGQITSRKMPHATSHVYSAGMSQEALSMRSMTMRDWLAAHAPKEVLNIDGWSTKQRTAALGLQKGSTYEWRKNFVSLIAKISYEYADAMLEARK